MGPTSTKPILIRTLAVADTLPKTSRPWTYVPGMPLPQGGYAQPDEQRGLFAWEAQEFSYITIELGIDWAPIIEWKEGLTDNEGNTFSRYEYEMVLHRLATQFGFSFVQVAEAPNNTATV